MINLIWKLSRLLLKYKSSNELCQKACLCSIQPAIEKVKLKNIDIIDSQNCLTDEKTLNTNNETILKILHLPKMIVNEIIKEYPKFEKTSSEDILRNYKIMEKYGVRKSVMINNVHLFAHSDNELLEKLAIIDHFGININNAIIFADLNLNMLTKFWNLCQNEDMKPIHKIKAVGEMLQVDEKTMCAFFKKNVHLRTTPLDLLKKKIQLLLDAGFTRNAIMSDGTVLSYSLDKIESNLNLLSKYKIEKKKLWMIRSSELTLKKYVSRNLLRSEINGKEQNLNEYIAKRLKCSPATVDYLIQRNPHIDGMSIYKAKKVMDVLEEFNIKQEQIIMGSNLFSRSVETLKKRLSMVKQKFGYIPDSIYFLYLSEDKFDKFMKHGTFD